MKLNIMKCIEMDMEQHKNTALKKGKRISVAKEYNTCIKCDFAQWGCQNFRELPPKKDRAGCSYFLLGRETVVELNVKVTN